MQINQARHQLRQDLIPQYGESEAGAIAAMVIQKLTGYNRADLLLHGSEALNDEQFLQYAKWRKELIAWKPVQYVLGECWFAGMPFYVDEHVLIPRPETEELVQWVREDMAERGIRDHRSGLQTRILDAGTGSGCIAIALQKSIPGAELWAADFSREALAVASANAKALSSDIHFRELDIMDPLGWQVLPSMDLIVSNPPYIPRSDAGSMRPNVIRYEPEMALFVANDDPLVFYRAIGALALEKLLPGGAIYFELHEDLAEAASDLMHALGYANVSMKKDLQGKWRMLRVRR